MKKELISLTLIIVIVLQSCNRKQQEDSVVKDCCDTSYYPSGRIMVIAEMENGSPNGWQYDYSESGEIKNKSMMKNGYREGVSYQYFSNGRIRATGRYINNKALGDVLWYYSNGNLQSYSCYDFQGYCIYKEQFSQNGELMDRSGKLVVQLLSDVPFDSIFCDSAFQVHICLANSPYLTERYTLTQFDDKKNVIEDVELKPNNNLVTLNKKFSSRGKVLQMVVGQSFDSMGVFIQSDTLLTQFDVR